MRIATVLVDGLAADRTFKQIWKKTNELKKGDLEVNNDGRELRIDC